MSGVVLVLVGLGFSLDRQVWTKPTGRYGAALVQGNIDQAIKWDADQRLNNVRKHMQLSEEHWDADVLIWPEFALTLYGQDAVAVTDLLNRRGDVSQTNVVVGMPDVQWQDQERYQVFNSAQGFGRPAASLRSTIWCPLVTTCPCRTTCAVSSNSLICLCPMPVAARAIRPILCLR